MVVSLAPHLVNASAEASEERPPQQRTVTELGEHEGGCSQQADRCRHVPGASGRQQDDDKRGAGDQPGRLQAAIDGVEYRRPGGGER